ncbi:hypothetical protein OZD68_06145 [Wolbachia endosymbiont of Drosophila bicornuta]|nr:MULTISPECIES: hypothetical protein [Wolbachia]MDE5057130.1 hypothetical protein [Wolbachia endosymbiont of Drosophila bicornuta]
MICSDYCKKSYIYQSETVLNSISVESSSRSRSSSSSSSGGPGS